MLWPFKSWQVHGIWAERRLLLELLGFLTWLYSRVGNPHMPQAACLPACLCVAHCMPPVPLCGTCCGIQQGVPTCLSTRDKQSWKAKKIIWHSMILHMRAHFMLWGQFSGPSLKAMRTLLIRSIQSYGNMASLSYRDTWVRKPDCLHLPYRYMSFTKLGKTGFTISPNSFPITWSFSSPSDTTMRWMLEHLKVVPEAV